MQVRVDVQNLRSKIRGMRRVLQEKHYARSIADNEYFQFVRVCALRESSEHLDELVVRKTLDGLLENCQCLRDECGPLEDDCDLLEYKLSKSEFELTTLEEKFYQYYGRASPQPWLLVLPTENKLGDDLEYHPLVKEYVSRSGDLGLLRERLDTYIEENTSLEAEREARSRAGLKLSRGELAWLDNYEDSKDSLVRQIEEAENVVEVLRRHCLAEGLVDEKGEPKSSGNREKRDVLKDKGIVEHALEYVKYHPFNLAKSRIRWYHTSASTFLDLVDDSDLTDLEGTERLRLRASSRKLGSPFTYLSGVGKVLLKEASSDLRTPFKAMCREQPIGYWPAQDPQHPDNDLDDVLFPQPRSRGEQFHSSYLEEEGSSKTDYTNQRLFGWIQSALSGTELLAKEFELVSDGIWNRWQDFYAPKFSNKNGTKKSLFRQTLGTRIFLMAARLIGLHLALSQLLLVHGMPTEPPPVHQPSCQPHSTESLISNAIIAMGLGLAYMLITYFDKLFSVMIVVAIGSFFLGMDNSNISNLQLAIICSFSASLITTYLQKKLSDLPRSGGLTGLCIATLGSSCAGTIAYFFGFKQRYEFEGRFANPWVLGAVVALPTTMLSAVFWAAAFLQTGLAKSLEEGKYNEPILHAAKGILSDLFMALIVQIPGLENFGARNNMRGMAREPLFGVPFHANQTRPMFYDEAAVEEGLQQS